MKQASSPPTYSWIIITFFHFIYFWWHLETEPGP